MAEIPSRVKITVLRCFSTEEVFKDSPVKAKYKGPCPAFKDGQEFIIDPATRDGAAHAPVKPQGFCPYAWDALFWVIMALRSGADFLEWYDEPGVAVGCCADGLRPAIFKLERI